MKELELIKFEDSLPIKLNCMFVTDTPRHWHSALEILLVLNGSADVTFDDKLTHIKDDDVLLINSGVIHELKSTNGCAIVSMQIDIEKLDSRYKDLRFNCNSTIDNNKGRYYIIKHLIAKIVKTNSSDTAKNEFLNKSILFSILHELNQNFKSVSLGQEPSSQKYLERLNQIITYINDNYRNAITLNDLAEHEHLSVPYLSSFFEKYFGLNFLTYYNEIRLNHAVNDLLSSDDSVETIALNNGFTDPRSFVTIFKRKYDTLPSLYRKKQQNSHPQTKDERINYLDFDKVSYLSILAKYLPADYQKTESSTESISDKNINITKISMLNSSKQLKHNFKVFTSVGRAKEILFSEVQNMLKQLQNDVGFEYIKFHGLLSDDMHFYTENAAGQPIYSFVLIDKVIDFLLSIQLKPLIQLSFMPLALASDKNKNIYSTPFNVSPPLDYTKWENLVTELTLHFINRYGMKAVKTWLFCAWNEPDTSENMFGFKNDHDFYILYKSSYNAVKSVNKALKFGSPSLLMSYNIDKSWAENFFKFTLHNDCVPDFLNMHYYDNDFSNDTKELHRPAQPAHNRLNRDENAFQKTIRQIKLFLSDLNLNIPIYLTEWNLTVSHRNLLNDTCFKSCYITKNLLENYDELDSFGYWVLTDFLEELQPSQDVFHGGLGLFTYNGIRKPHYYTFKLLNKLGDKMIAKGNGYFITKSYGKIQILIYNYEHFNHLFADGEIFDMTYTKRYTPFSELGKMDISLELTDIPVQNCLIKEYIVNQKHGSAFDKWVNMGAKQMDYEDIEYLKSISIPKIITRQATITNNSLIVSAALLPLEIRFIELTIK